MSGIFDGDYAGTAADPRDEAERYRQERLQAAEEQRALIRSVFDTPAGHELLGRWRQRVLMAPTYVEGASLDRCAFVEGQKQIVREIEAAFGPPLRMEE